MMTDQCPMRLSPIFSWLNLGKKTPCIFYFTFMMTDQCPMRLSPIFSWVKLGQEYLQVLLYFYDDRSVSYEIESYI